MRVAIIGALAAFALGACTPATIATLASQDALAVHDAARGYIGEVHDDRRWVRDKCRSILELEVQRYLAAGNFEKARALMAAAYPRLVTLETVATLRRGNPDNLLATAYLCTPHLAGDSHPRPPPE